MLICYFVTLLMPTKSHQEGYQQIGLSLGHNFTLSVDPSQSSFKNGTHFNSIVCTHTWTK